MNLFKTAIFTILVPGTVSVVIPQWLLASRPPDDLLHLGPFRYAGPLVVALGALIYLWCAWDFATAGRGTPAPIDPPKQLVARGLYRFSRNPMYVGVLSVIVGQAVLFESRRLFILAAGAFVIFHTFVLLYEEPTLRRKFGESYIRYCEKTPRWIFRIRRQASPRNG